MRGQGRIGVGEFFEGPARDFRDYIIDGRLEASRRLAGDVVLELIEPVADGQLGGDLGDWKTGGFRGQRAGPAHARVHLDGDHFPVVGIDGELDVAAARLNADLADNGDGGVAHPLVFLVGQRLGRRHGDRIAGVHSHGVKILDGADDDDVVRLIAHDFQFKFLPT